MPLPSRVVVLLTRSMEVEMAALLVMWPTSLRPTPETREIEPERVSFARSKPSCRETLPEMVALSMRDATWTRIWPPALVSKLAAVDGDVVEIDEGGGGCICRCTDGRCDGSTGVDHGAVGEVGEEAAFEGEIGAGERGESSGIDGECGDLADVEEEAARGVDCAGIVDWGEK